MNKDELEEYKVAYRVIRKFLARDKGDIKAGEMNSFTVVKNYLANAIAEASL